MVKLLLIAATLLVVLATTTSASSRALSSALSDYGGVRQRDCLIGVNKIASGLKRLLHSLKTGERIDNLDLESIYQQLDFKRCRESLLAAFFGVNQPACPVCPTCKTCEVCPPPVVCPKTQLANVSISLVAATDLTKTLTSYNTTAYPGQNNLIGSYNYPYSCRLVIS